MLKRTFVLLMFVAAACSQRAQDDSGKFMLESEAFHEKAKTGITIIDVRTVEEYTQGHIPGAMNVDVNHPSFQENILMLDKTKDYGVYCASGVRSRKAAEAMRKEGFTSVYTLTGGMVAWEEKGLPQE